jgi:arginyl-tRNA synthetase
MNETSILNLLRDRFAAAVAHVAGAPTDPLVRAAQDARHGDYQCNVAMSLGKALGRKPRDIAQDIVAAADLAGVAEPPEVAGPGFINVRLTAEFLAARLGAIPAAESGADRLGLAPAARPQRMVVDYSSPNIAKQMHVGHLRSTIIGDVFVRTLRFVGHEVIGQNHVGDWGTQFGILIEHYREHPLPTPATHADVLGAIEDDYRAAQQRFKTDAAFAEAARAAVGRLQAGDADARRVWGDICRASRGAFVELYGRLGVLLDDEAVRGESFYNDRLAPTVAELQAALAPGHSARAELRVDQGAQCIFLRDEQGQPAFLSAEKEPLPLIVQKSDGAFLYATTDLAALRYRIRELQARRIIYVTDARQKLHFEMVFATARAVGWAGPDVVLDHVTFGSVLGEDRRPLKTREGQNVKLRELLDEAERRALAVLEQRAAARAEEGEGGEAFDAAEQRDIARAIGVAAVKYADLRNDRVTDYVFDWDKMLALQGNTAPYLMYGYARVRSIYRKAAERFGAPDVYTPGVALAVGAPAERTLALRLARFGETVEQLASDLSPHVLCTYLFELAQEFMRFYEACPVLAAEDEATRLGRMRLCDLTARTLRVGLHLLGIEVVERM